MEIKIFNFFSVLMFIILLKAENSKGLGMFKAIKSVISGNEPLKEVIFHKKFESNIDHVSVFKDVTLNNHNFYNPMDTALRKKKCEKLGLKFQKSTKEYPKNIQKILTKPRNILDTTTVDPYNVGNVTYELLSQLLCNTDQYHETIRDVIHKNSLQSKPLRDLFDGDQDKLNKYLETRRINENSIIGTDVELFIAAYALDVCIYVYRDGPIAMNKWTLYHKNWPNLENLDMKNEKCLYIAEPFLGCAYYAVEDVA
ncbi:uncharacterized protein LOC126909381 isoform X4 [Daktulosphaira vitifoliae]|uniref:uncharacterized protein LOC126909381 isoform X4 n=1 Tax=Daktulosphaira vitifoliae TaxID=58002 RepID=UPI0021AACEFB|nr:uncharacterized protein LOC126909381 isoform X4 [Daktulosphaira vitifoliae]